MKCRTRVIGEKNNDKEKDKVEKTEDKNMGSQKRHLRTSKRGYKFVAGRRPPEPYYITAFDPTIRKRVVHIVANGWATSLVTGHRFRYP